MSLRTCTTLVTSLFLAVVIVAISVLVLSTQRTEMHRESVRKIDFALKVMVELVRNPLQQQNAEALTLLVDRISAAERVGPARVADSNGIVMADSEGSVVGRPLPQRVISETSSSIDLAGDWWIAAHPVLTMDGQTLGYAYFELDGKPFQAALARTRRNVLFFGIGALLIGGILAYMFGGVLGRACTPITTALRRAGEGELSLRMPGASLLEVRQIQEAFNSMTAKLEARISSTEVISDLASLLIRAPRLDDAAELVVSACERITDSVCSVWVKSQITGCYDLMPARSAAFRPAEGTIVSHVIDEGRAMTIGRDNADYPSGTAVAPGVEPDVAVVVPLVAPPIGGVGVIVLTYPTERIAPRREDMAEAMAIGNVAAPAIASLQRAEVRERAAQTLAAMLLPPPPAEILNLDIAARFRPAQIASGLGGDYYDFLEIDEGGLAITIGDVAGKGIEAAQYTGMAKYLLRAYALERHSPAATLAHTNSALVAQTASESFITLFYSVIDTKVGCLSYCSAGHPPGLLYQVDTGRCLHLQPGGPAAGISDGVQYQENSVLVRPGDVLVLVTDGVTEARRGKEMFEIDRVESSVIRFAHYSASDIAEGLLGDVLAFTSSRLTDDVAIVVAKVNLPAIP